MQRRHFLLIALAGITLYLASPGWADIPAPPVNQTIGMVDVAMDSLVEADCRVCHSSGVPDRHHLLYGQPIPDPSFVPFPDADGDGNPDTIYVCLNCHDENFTVVRDCLVCHTASPHHITAAAAAGDCVACHGDIVDNMDDGHYVPTYSPSLVTPYRSVDDDPLTDKPQGGLPLNARGNGSGACNYCHDDDGLSTPVILQNDDLHHWAGFALLHPICHWCHDFNVPFEEEIRTCEGCHGPDSLHNIQADSNGGGIVVGGEDAGYGHIGRDAGPGDSDCWGCHGFAMGAAAPGSGPVIPSIVSSDLTVVNAGSATSVVLSGVAFTNISGTVSYESDVTLTAADGSVVTLTPDVIDQSVMGVTIPADTAPGNYNVQAVKAEFGSNPVVISVIPGVIVTDVAADGATVTINGGGFGGYAAGSGTAVTGKITTGKGKRKVTTTVDGTIVSWSETSIVAQFDSSPNEVTVNSVFGTDTSEVGGDGGGDNGGGGKPPKPPKPPKE